MKSILRRPQFILTFLCWSVALWSASMGAAAESTNDIIEVNSVWKSSQRHQLKIIERKGETFRGMFSWDGVGNSEVSGKIKGNKIFWHVKDVRVISGDPGGDNFGTIIGNHIEFTWHRRDNGLSGAYTLFWVKP